MDADPNKPKPKPKFGSPRGASARKWRRQLYKKQKKIAAAAAAAPLSFDKDEDEPAASAAAQGLLGLARAADPSQAVDVDLTDCELREPQQLRDSESKLEADEPLLEEALKRLTDTMDRLEEACGGDYTFIGDNIDFLVKVVGSSKAKRNKLYHWFHLIGIIRCPVIGRFWCADMKGQNESCALLPVRCVWPQRLEIVSLHQAICATTSPPATCRTGLSSGLCPVWTTSSS